MKILLIDCGRFRSFVFAAEFCDVRRHFLIYFPGRAGSINSNKIRCDFASLMKFPPARVQVSDRRLPFSGKKYFRGGIKEDGQVRPWVKPIETPAMDSLRGRQFGIRCDVTEGEIIEKMTIINHNIPFTPIPQ